MVRRAALLGVFAAASGCSVPETGTGTAPLMGGAPAFIAGQIETEADGRCYGRDVTPAVIETVTAQELEREEVRDADGNIVIPAIYRSIVRQAIVRERQEVRFETLCPPAYNAEFVASLQRALAARGFYRGEVNGTMDEATGRAVQDFQRGDGPDSPLLWAGAARKLGLVALTGAQLDAL